MSTPEDLRWPPSSPSALEAIDNLIDRREAPFEGAIPLPEPIEPSNGGVVAALDADGILQFSVMQEEVTIQRRVSDAENVSAGDGPSPPARERTREAEARTPTPSPLPPPTSHTSNGMHSPATHHRQTAGHGLTNGSRSPAATPVPPRPTSESSDRSHVPKSLREETPAAGPSRTPLVMSPKYDLVPISQSPVTPVPVRISLSQGTPTVAYLRKVDQTPTQIYRAVPSDDKDVRPRINGKASENRAFVVLRMARKTRDTLIARGVYDPFRDDWEPPPPAKRLGGASKFLQDAEIRGSKGGAKTARARPPEPIVDRFIPRPGPAVLEPWASVLTADSLLNRLGEYECGWKGCGAVLNSENNLAKHIRRREHAMDGVFTVGSWGQVVLYACKWQDCDEPCFDSVQNLLQHITAVHVSKDLLCPYGRCDLRARNMSHLQRHVMKQHDEESDVPRVRADQPWRPPLKPLPDLPKVIRTEELVTLPVRPEPARSQQRAEWVRKRVEKYCMAGDDPEIHIVHPPHMLEVLDTASASGTATPALDSRVPSESEARDVKPNLKRRKRKFVFSKRPKYIAKRSKLFNVYTHTSPHPVDRCYVEIPWTRPYRRPGEPVVVYHLADLEAMGEDGGKDSGTQQSEGEEEIEERQDFDEEEEEIEEYEQEDDGDHRRDADDIPSPPLLEASPINHDHEPLFLPHEDDVEEDSPEDFYSVASEGT